MLLFLPVPPNQFFVFSSKADMLDERVLSQFQYDKWIKCERDHWQVVNLHGYYTNEQWANDQIHIHKDIYAYNI